METGRSRSQENFLAVGLLYVTFKWFRSGMALLNLGKVYNIRIHCGMRVFVSTHGVTTCQATFHPTIKIRGQRWECCFVLMRYLNPLVIYCSIASPFCTFQFIFLCFLFRHLKMKLSSVLLALLTLASTGLAKTTCTPSFDYCADVLTKSKGCYT